MSLKAIIWVMEDAPVENHGELAVLYALADRANDDGSAAWPSQDWLAHRARCSDRTVRRVLLKLEERGVIRRGDQKLTSHLTLRRKPVVWDLNLSLKRTDFPTGQNDRFSKPDNGDIKTGQNEPQNRTTTTLKADTAMSDKPSVNPPEPSVNRPWESLRDWTPTAGQWLRLKEKHEGKDIESELEKFRDWHIEKKSQYKDWNRAFDNWLKRARPSKPRQKLFVVDDPDPYGLENAPF